MKKLISCSLMTVVGLALSTSALAAWPEKPITVVVPAAPGGTSDIVSRVLSEKLGAELGTTIIIDNKAGAAGIIGSQAVARAAPDGYTIAMGNIGANAINYSLYKKLPYKPTDFVPITMTIANPNILVVNANSPYKTVKELVDAIKKDPNGNFAFGSSGTGQSPHLSGEMFLQRAGIKAPHIPYKGAGPAVTALLGQQFTFMIDNLPSSMPSRKCIPTKPQKRRPCAPRQPTGSTARSCSTSSTGSRNARAKSTVSCRTPRTPAHRTATTLRRSRKRLPKPGLARPNSRPSCASGGSK